MPRIHGLFHGSVAMQHHQSYGAGVIESEGNAMKVALAHRYRAWMFVLLPSTLGLGSAALWLHSLNWPLELDEAGLTLRNHRQVSWDAIRKIGVSHAIATVMSARFAFTMMTA
jgi:hypothetical protein